MAGKFLQAALLSLLLLCISKTRTAFCGTALINGRKAQQQPGVACRARGGSACLDDLIKEALLKPDIEETSSEYASLQSKVDTQFPKLKFQDLSDLQMKFQSSPEGTQKGFALLTKLIQQSLESRMANAAKDVQELLMSSGNIDDNIRECLAKQETPIPIMTVLRMNVQMAQQSGNERQEKALTYVFSAITRELEKDVPIVNRILARCLATEDEKARRELLRAYISEQQEVSETEVRPEVDLAAAIVELVNEARSKFGIQGEQILSTLELIKTVGLAAGKEIYKLRGASAQETYMAALKPFFDALSEAKGGER